MSTVINIRYGSNLNTFISKPIIPIVNVKTIEEKELNIKKRMTKIVAILLSTYSYNHILTKVALGATVATQAIGPEAIRANFSKIIDVFTAISEPILWGYAIVGLILVATGNKQMGWSKVKSVAYAYIGIQCLPALFAFLRYIAKMLSSAFSS